MRADSPLKTGFRSPFEKLRVSGIRRVAMILPLMLRLSKHERRPAQRALNPNSLFKELAVRFVPFLFQALLGYEPERGTVDAVPQSRRCGAVGEDMP
jgi:hypothetical protein